MLGWQLISGPFCTVLLSRILHAEPSPPHPAPAAFPSLPPTLQSACVWCASLLSKQAGSPSSLGRRYLSEEVCVSCPLIVSCCSTKIFGGCVFHFKLKSSFYKYIQFPLILKHVRGENGSKWNSKQSRMGNGNLIMKYLSSLLSWLCC